ncbi:MAG: four helix bundle protein [Candidatus Aminicenantia bacterium]
MMKTFQDLKVWQKSHQLVLEIYKITKQFPQEEKFGLVTQMRRSAISIAANIAEGFKRKSDKEYSHFLNMAESSLEETKYYEILSKDLGYITQEKYQHLIDISEETGRGCFTGLLKSLILNPYRL